MGPVIIVSVPRALRATAGHKVDLEGFEPSTSSVRLRRAPNCATGPFFRVIGILPLSWGTVKISQGSAGSPPWGICEYLKLWKS